MDTTILIVDDDPDIRRVVRMLLAGRGHTALEAASGEEALALLAHTPADLIILDVMMPEQDGYETCRRLRELSQAPVLFLTAKTQEEDKLSAYETGGDDFLGKPFSPAELLMKVDALLRRYLIYRGKPVSHTGLTEEGGQFFKNGSPLELTDKEAQILRLLYQNRGKVLETQRIYEAVWQEKFLPSSTNTVMVHVLHLRKKLEDEPAHPKLIKTVWGRGYSLAN